jgi:two-component system LytT family response regulator
MPDVVILDTSADEGAFLRAWPDEVDARTVPICLADDVHYALDAFKANAAHYLTLPLESADVEMALSRAVRRLQTYDGYEPGGGRMVAAHPAPEPYQCRVIALPSASSIELRTPEELVSAHGEGSYTRVVLRKEPPVLLSRCLGDLEPELVQVGLMRVHRSHMVNVGLIRSVRRGKLPVIQLVDGTELDVGERYKDSLFNVLRISRRRRQ